MAKTRVSTRKAFSVIIWRDLMLSIRHPSEIINPLLFFIMVIILYPFAVGSDAKLLMEISTGVVWVAALLASMLSLDSIFKEDFADGTLEEMILSAHPTSILVLAKVFAHWLLTALPLIILAPILAVMLGMHDDGIVVLLLTLLIGTPVLSLIGAIGVALTVSLRGGGVILSLLILPLYIPVLIFGSGAVNNAILGLDVQGQIYMLAALFVLALFFAPLAIAAALKISLS
ncbi:MAG: heme exporter protein CcmB [Gammaproteobacteria bacterium]|nr:heme exporter protein CcmB [Gammaproteobacteria bacterium]